MDWRNSNNWLEVLVVLLAYFLASMATILVALYVLMLTMPEWVVRGIVVGFACHIASRVYHAINKLMGVK